VREGKLEWIRGGPGPLLDAVAPNRFRFPPGTPAELLFPTITKGEPQEMQVLSGGTVTPYRKAEPFVQPKRGIAEYAGRYRSDEVDVTLNLVARDSVIEVSTPGSWGFRAEPLLKDAFALPDVIVMRFVRSGGRVTGFIADMPRSRGMTFTKLPFGVQ